jgi:pentatricopeptide repeat protein
MADGCEADCRMATTLIEVCARAGDTDRAIATYDMMRASPVSSRLTPSGDISDSVGALWSPKSCI